MRPSLRLVPVLIVSASLAPLLMLPAPGRSTPLYATRMGLACANCHFDPNGGGPRNAFGFAFAKNRHSTDAETSGVFKDLDLTNRVSEQLPLYFGVNQRLMMLLEDASDSKGLDRFGFYNMESAIHLAFQPHSRLTLVYTNDGLDDGPRVTREAWGMVGIGSNYYLRAGEFRVPFGLRMDDHTVATRNGFLDFQGGARILPYDPRFGDEGLELGGTSGLHYGRIAFTNGVSSPIGGGSTHAQAVSAKIGYAGTSFQDGFSGYDEWNAAPLGGQTRASRWGWYGTAHRGQVSLIGEVVAGTDQFAAAPGSGETDFKSNRLAWFAEADYQANRALNLRARYDRMETDRSSDPATRDAGSYSRYALEGDIVPIPFAELRWTLRLIDPDLSTKDNEKQAYLQLHFSY
jgi:hypothetical protein